MDVVTAERKTRVGEGTGRFETLSIGQESGKERESNASETISYQGF